MSLLAWLCAHDVISHRWRAEGIGRKECRRCGLRSGCWDYSLWPPEGRTTE